MKRLTAYLAKAFAVETLGLFAATLVLLWLVECLRIFDVISVKGQNLWVLGGQAGLAMPTLARLFLYVCMGIGLGRALRALHQSRELHIIHASRRVGGLLAGTGVFAAAGVITVALLANIIEPLSSRQLKSWTANVAADMVGRTLVPHRFSQIAPGLMMVIGGREAGGKVVDFFADDRRDPDQRRTYTATSATVAEDENGYVMELQDGNVQYSNKDGQFSVVKFGRYDIALERFSSDTAAGGLSEINTPTLLMMGLENGGLSAAQFNAVVDRLGESLRVVAICAVVLALGAFPSGARTKFSLPIEVTVLLIAFVERTISSYAPGALGPVVGATIILLIGAVTLAWRFRPRRTQLLVRGASL